MTRGKAEDAGGLTPAKDDNAAPYHFDRRTLPIFKCVDYIKQALSKTEFCAKVLLDTFLSRKVSGKTDQKTLRYSSRLSFSNRWMPARLFPLASRAGE